MDVKLANLSKTEVKKHVGAIHVIGKLSLLERKIANVLLWNAYDDLLTKEKHRIRIRDLALVVGFDSHDDKLLKSALRELAAIPLEWNLLHEDGEEEWGVAPMLAQATIRAGFCSYVYAPDLREKFYNPEIYARINLGIQRNISSGYALTLYENCVRYRNVGSTGWIDLSTFKTLLGIDESKHYSVFKHFNGKVLKPAINAVNKASDIFLSVEFERQKRRIVALKIKVEANPQMPLFNEEQLSEAQLMTGVDEANESHGDGVDRLLTFGLTQRSAEKLLAEHQMDYIEQNLDVVERDYQAGRVKNLPAYTISALKEDYRPKQSEYEVKQAKEKQVKKERIAQSQLAQKRLENLEKEFSSHRLQQALEQFSEAEEKDLQNRFLQKQKGNRFFSRWMKEGFEHRVVQALFRSFAAEELLGEAAEEDFKKFAKGRGEDLDVIKQVAASV